MTMRAVHQAKIVKANPQKLMAFLDREINFNEDSETLAKSQIKDMQTTPSTATKSLPKSKTKQNRIRMPNSSTTTNFPEENNERKSIQNISKQNTFKPVRKGHPSIKIDRNAGVNQYIRHLDKRTQEML